MNYNWKILYTDLSPLSTSTELSKSSGFAVFYSTKGVWHWEVGIKRSTSAGIKIPQATPLESAGMPLWLGLRMMLWHLGLVMLGPARGPWADQHWMFLISKTSWWWGRGFESLQGGPIKFNTNYSPEETHEAAVLKKHRNNKANKQQLWQRLCSCRQ